MGGIVNILFGRKPDADEKKKKCMDLHDEMERTQTTTIDISKDVEEVLKKKPAKSGNGR